MGTGDGAAAAMRQLKRPTMTDPRIEAMARAIKDHVDWNDDESIARIGLAAADAVDEVREAARDALHCCCAVHGSARREALATQEASDD